MAESFDAKLDISGVVLTKMDGGRPRRARPVHQARHGQGHQVRGHGREASDLEIFHPDRVASRILGMGDVLTLIEKAQRPWTRRRPRRLGQKFQRAEFDFEDFRTQMRRLEEDRFLREHPEAHPRMGALKDKLGEMKVPDKELGRVEAMINSSDPCERRNPALIDKSRKERIARGSGLAWTT